MITETAPHMAEILGLDAAETSRIEQNLINLADNVMYYGLVL